MLRQYPGLPCASGEEVVTVLNPPPKPRLARESRGAARRNKVRWHTLARDGWQALRAFS